MYYDSANQQFSLFDAANPPLLENTLDNTQFKLTLFDDYANEMSSFPTTANFTL